MNESREAKINRLNELSRQIRLDGLDMALSTGQGGSHIGGSFSCVEIMAVLYGEVMKIDPKNPEWEERDRLLPSKNHCVLAHFPALAAAGFLERSELTEFQKDGGRMTGYPRNLEIGLEYSGGSLGMAISVGIGIALASKEQKRSNRVYVLLGDGELHEGSNWEGIMSAAHYGLDNLTLIIDRNHLSYDGDTEEVMALGNLADKFACFGYHVISCNGHDVGELIDAFAGQYEEGKPAVIIADTVKGKGVSFLENKRESHHIAITKEQYELAVRELTI